MKTSGQILPHLSYAAASQSLLAAFDLGEEGKFLGLSTQTSAIAVPTAVTSTQSEYKGGHLALHHFLPALYSVYAPKLVMGLPFSATAYAVKQAENIGLGLQEQARREHPGITIKNPDRSSNMWKTADGQALGREGTAIWGPVSPPKETVSRNVAARSSEKSVPLKYIPLVASNEAKQNPMAVQS